jgi:hypothetical protein
MPGNSSQILKVAPALSPTHIPDLYPRDFSVLPR